MFSAEGLPNATPDELWEFITSKELCDPGRTSAVLATWKELGPDGAAASVRATIEHLLRGDGEPEERLDELIRPGNGTPGFKEALLTKVLAIANPDRVLALVAYDSATGKGKRDIGRVVFGLDMPAPDTTGMSRGRLAYWSNDRLRDLALDLPGDPFVDLEHAKEFLWQAFCHLQGWPSVFDRIAPAS